MIHFLIMLLHISYKLNMYITSLKLKTMIVHLGKLKQDHVWTISRDSLRIWYWMVIFLHAILLKKIYHFLLFSSTAFMDLQVFLLGSSNHFTCHSATKTLLILLRYLDEVVGLLLCFCSGKLDLKGYQIIRSSYNKMYYCCSLFSGYLPSKKYGILRGRGFVMMKMLLWESYQKKEALIKLNTPHNKKTGILSHVYYNCYMTYLETVSVREDQNW